MYLREEHTSMKHSPDGEEISILTRTPFDVNPYASIYIHGPIPTRDHRHHPDMTPVRILSGGHESDVTSMTMMTDLESGTGRLLSCGKDGKVMIWDYTKGTIIRVHRFGMELNTVQFNEVSREIYAGTETGTILRIATISEDEYRMRSRHHMLDGLAYPGDGQQGGGMTDAPELSALNAEIIDYILRN
eukprot:gb/GECH01008977.1/.p1 GENE.gb/GECH01008977.1/~~gb/GECH01008977.1/.p1  ORF type:complete len:188 (+),score=7.83 gb/GECH01008977.1/:1-564(+)